MISIRTFLGSCFSAMADSVAREKFGTVNVVAQSEAGGVGAWHGGGTGDAYENDKD